MNFKKNISTAITELIRSRRIKVLGNRSGWVMAEALIGITIITVGLLAIMLSHIQTTKSANFSDNTTKATYIAQQQLEIIKRTYDITQLIPANPIACTAPGGIFTLTCATDTATLPVTGLNIVPVSATVTWTDSSSAQQKTLKLTTYFFHKD